MVRQRASPTEEGEQDAVVDDAGRQGPEVRCQILRLKCTKIVFGWGSAPDPAGGA